MGFLDEGGCRGRNDQGVIGPLDHLAPILTGQGQGLNPFLLGRLESPEDIRGVAAGADRHQDISGQTQGPDLFLEDTVEAEVIADTGDNGSIGTQGQGG